VGIACCVCYDVWVLHVVYDVTCGYCVLYVYAVMCRYCMFVVYDVTCWILRVLVCVCCPVYVQTGKRVCTTLNSNLSAGSSSSRLPRKQLSSDSASLVVRHVPLQTAPGCGGVQSFSIESGQTHTNSHPGEGFKSPGGDSREIGGGECFKVFYLFCHKLDYINTAMKLL